MFIVFLYIGVVTCRVILIITKMLASNNNLLHTILFTFYLYIIILTHRKVINKYVERQKTHQRNISKQCYLG